MVTQGKVRQGQNSCTRPQGRAEQPSIGRWKNMEEKSDVELSALATGL